MERERAEFDVVIVGAGIAGLSAAIRLKQIAPHLTVTVVEKGAEVGAHILSGAVIDPVGINTLLPGWNKNARHPFNTPVKQDFTHVLTRNKAYRLPHFLTPRILSNQGNYIVSLGAVCRWLAQQAEELGVDIFPGFAVKDGVFAENGALIGIITGDMGLEADGSPGAGTMPGMELRAKYVLVAEGACGSLAQALIKRYGLDKVCNGQKYGLGLKELWEIAPEKHKQGVIEHYFGWPLGKKATGGGFVYHMQSNRLALGLIVHLDYANPYISPFEEFQQWKTHPALRPLLTGGRRLAYGARVINEGGWQSVPRLSFAGGALIGCAAGFVNLPRLKGSHNAVLSAIAAAEAVAAAIAAGRAHDEIIDIETGWRHSAIGRDLYPARNAKPLLERYGSVAGAVLGGADIWCGQIFGFSLFGTLRHKNSDAAALGAAANYQEIAYPKPDNQVSFDRASSVYLANIRAREGAPCHLRVKNRALQKTSEWGVFAGPSQRYCPAGVYEWLPEAKAAEAKPVKGLPPVGNKGKSRQPAQKNGIAAVEMQYHIQAQNCVQCKSCAIKDPNGNIDWTVPEGGEGPIYPDM